MVVTASLWGWDWGTTAEWFGAVGTIGAVIVALWFGSRDGKRLDAELSASASDRAEAADERRQSAEDRAQYRQDRAADKEERFQELARQVGFTVSPRPVLTNTGRIRDPTFDNGAVLTVHNHGPFPIYSVRLVFEDPSGDKAEFLKEWDSVQPGEQVAHTVPHSSRVISDAWMVDLYFRDVRNNNWETNIDGELFQGLKLSEYG